MKRVEDDDENISESGKSFQVGASSSANSMPVMALEFAEVTRAFEPKA